VRGISHPNTDLDAQTFLMRVRRLRQESAGGAPLPVAYRPQVTGAELDDPTVLIWDIGRSHDPLRGNFDHHQDHTLGATPIILRQALGEEPNALDRYVDLGDRGYFFKHPQPHPVLETLHGVAAGINLVYGDDGVRQPHYQALLEWVEDSGVDPFGRFTEQVLPHQFHPFLEARRFEERQARAAARCARWFDTRLGRVAYIATDKASVMRVLYDKGAVLVILHEPQGRMSGWSRCCPRYTLGANPARIAIPEQLDLRPLFVTLSGMEPSGNPWGGQAGVGGSPREDGGSGLTAEQVMQAVRSYMA
jgi:hypothetical protein